MKNDASYALIREMLETPGVMRGFDASLAAPWTAKIAARKKLMVTGEGSSRIFPAKNMRTLAMQRGLGWHIHTEGARQAAEYALDDFIVLGASNSGRTRELTTLSAQLTARGIPFYAVTATPGSKVTEGAAGARVLSCGQEKAVAATKSVVEQALVYQSLLGGSEWKNLKQAADAMEEILTRAAPADIVDAMKDARVIYFSGRNDGVAEELTLKINEIVRRKSAYLEGTYAVHGIEEVMAPDETVVLIEPFREEIDKYQQVLAQGVGMKVVAIASFDTPFPTFKIPRIEGFDTYLQLVAGWRLLVATGLANGIDLDRPVRARKVGNEVSG